MRIATVLSSIVLLVGCGGGGGGGGGNNPPPPPSPTTISGTAAAGSPILGSVTVTDSSAPPIVTVVNIGSNGAYTVDISGMTAPYILRADGVVGGRAVSVHSVAFAADVGGTVNVTPLTELVLSNALGTAVANATPGALSAVTSGAIDSAETALQTQLQDLLTALGVPGSIDLVNTAFSTDHTGVDAALDALRVDVDPATNAATITNVVNATSVTDDLTIPADVIAVDATNTAGALTDFQQMVQKFDQWSTLFATAPLPAATDPALRALFHDAPPASGGFQWDGENLTDFLTMLTTETDPVSGTPVFLGATFSNITLDGVDNPAAPTEALLSFTITFAQGRFETFQTYAHKVGSDWLIAGNQKIGMAQAASFVRTGDNVPGGNDTGLVFEIDNSSTSTFDYAVVTGPGLPTTTGGVDGASAGLLYFNPGTGNSFTLAAAGAAYNGTATTGISQGHNQYVMDDTALGAVADNSVYTITLYEDGGTVATGDDTVVDTYTDTSGKRPYLNSELAAITFPQITTAASAIRSFAENGGSLTVDWTLPAGLRASQVHFFRNDAGQTINDTADADVLATATSTVLTMPAPAFTVAGSGMNLYVQDVFARELVVIKNGQ